MAEHSTVMELASNTKVEIKSVLTDDRRNMLKRSGDVYSVGIVAGGPSASVSPANTNVFAAIRKEKSQ